MDRAPGSCPILSLCKPLALGTRGEAIGSVRAPKRQESQHALGLDWWVGVQGAMGGCSQPAYHGSRVMVLSHGCPGLC